MLAEARPVTRALPVSLFAVVKVPLAVTTAEAGNSPALTLSVVGGLFTASTCTIAKLA